MFFRALFFGGGGVHVAGEEQKYLQNENLKVGD
jgi:hypothetical protein